MCKSRKTQCCIVVFEIVAYKAELTVWKFNISNPKYRGPNAGSHLIRIKLDTQELEKSQIINLREQFEISIWWI